MKKLRLVLALIICLILVAEPVVSSELVSPPVADAQVGATLKSVPGPQPGFSIEGGPHHPGQIKPISPLDTLPGLQFAKGFKSPQEVDPDRLRDQLVSTFFESSQTYRDSPFVHSPLDPGDDRPGRPDIPPPPHRQFRVHNPICDLNDDGTVDVIANERTLVNPPIDRSGPSRLKAISGATGDVLWQRPDTFFETLVLAGADYRRHGEPLPQGPRNFHAVGDLDQDGVCDLVAIGFGAFQPDLFGVAMIQDYVTEVNGVSGATGQDIWSWTIDGQLVLAVDPLGLVTIVHISDFPTGHLAFDSPGGPRALIKTTDVEYTVVEDPLGAGIAIEDLQVTERLHLLNATNGAVLWDRELTEDADVGLTAFTWIEGVADLSGDGEPEILLNHMTITNPQGGSEDHPLTGETLYRYAKGMRMTALKGDPAEGGDPLWTTTILDPFLVRPNADVEESFEHLVWTHGRLIGDITDSGRETPLASYVAQEETLSGTASGRYRTHFVPLHPENGSILWDVRHQGWGYAETLGTDAQGPSVLGFGMVDVPTLPPPGGRFPPKFIRMGTMDADTGATIWATEQVYAQNSFLTYNMALAQFRTALAPHDWTGDGLRDLVTPSRYVMPEGENQVLLAISHHEYEILRARDGDLLSTFSAWGPDGRVIACPGANEYLTVISGFGRRLDITRFDVNTGQQLWREPVWNNPSPLSATQGIDLVGLGVDCTDLADGRTHVSINAQAFSGLRGHEVLSVNGFPHAFEENATWLHPELRGAPPTSSVFEPHGDPVPVSAGLLASGILVGLVAGLLAAAAVVFTHRQGRSFVGAMVVVLVLLLLSSLFLPISQATLGSGTEPLAEEQSETADPGLKMMEPGAGLVDPQTTLDPDGAGAPPTNVQRDEPRPSQPAKSSDHPIAQGPHIVPDVPDERVPTAWAGLSAAEGAPADAIAPDAPINGAVLPASPYLELLAGLDDLPTESGPRDHLAAVEEYYRKLGWPVHAQASVDPASQFDPQGALAFTHELGDVTGDGVDDFLLDDLCVDPEVCTMVGGDAVDDALDLVLGDGSCGPPHQLRAINGADGSGVWNLTMNRGTATDSCSFSFVVGVVPLEEDHRGVLVYTISATWTVLNTPRVLEHEFMMVAADTGETLWTFSEPGYLANSLLAGMSGRSVFVHPVLQLPPEGGVRAVDASQAAPSLHLQGVGFDTPFATTLFRLPGNSDPIVVMESYQPSEWAARLDLASGDVLWREDTFLPQGERSVLPVLYDGAPSTPMSGDFMATTEDRYWDYRPCCFDNTGDGVPDLLYTTYEWASVPLARLQGPYDLDATIALYSGTDGDQRYTHTVVTDSPRPVRIQPQTTGDVTGDGAHDFLLHIETLDAHWSHDLIMRAGIDGSEIWRMEGVPTIRAYVIGDVDGDGGNDLLLVDWYGHLRTQGYVGDAHKVQGLPLTAVSGSDGSRLWQVTTYQAPVDVVFMMDLMERNGFPDFNGDGVADLFINDPLFLGDLTVVHHQTLISGKDATPMYTVETAGAFSVPFRIADITGDGTDDLAFLSGDLNDLWLTVYGNKDGEAIWSTRILSLPVSNYASAYPNIQVHSIARANETGRDFLMNFHLHIRSVAYTVYIPSSGDPMEAVLTTTTNTPQILRFQGLTGTLQWAEPVPDPPLGLVGGPSPATQAWAEASRPEGFNVQNEAQTALSKAYPSIVAFFAGFIIVLAISAWIGRGKKNKQEVPDLEDL